MTTSPTSAHPTPGTKAETLALLLAHDFPVPPLLYFTRARWTAEPEAVLAEIGARFPATALAVRSSACGEDSGAASLAGAFDSVLHVPSQDPAALRGAIATVVARYDHDGDQVLIQPMIPHVAMSGVVMTRTLDDGSPYYVINYDDISGRTDTITSGSGVSKTVYVYRGVKAEYFDSPRLRAVLDLVRRLEAFFAGLPLDVEFVVDARAVVHLLQARPIAAARHWRPQVAEAVSRHIRHVETYARDIMARRPGLAGSRSMLGVMPDWNPAEIIGVTPRPLAMSLYRDIITRQVWRLARRQMGYRALPPVELMLSLAGRPYIDVRASFNSFLPDGIPDPLAERLTEAWLDRLDAHPELHDKVEFAIVPTVLDFDFDATFRERYPETLSTTERLTFKAALRRLTSRALRPAGRTPAPGSLEKALLDARELERRQQALSALPSGTPFSLAASLTSLLEECREWGTLPFSIAARHAFMAESLLRSAVRREALSEDRLAAFKRTIRTVSGELSHDFAEAVRHPERRPAFMARYGHLRPGTYDILVPCYARRDLFADAVLSPEPPPPAPFDLTPAEHEALSRLLDETGLDCTPAHLLDYARQAIAGRERIKFIFTRHVCAVLETIAAWGERLELDREACAMLPLDVIAGSLHAPLPDEARPYYLSVIAEQRRQHELARSLRLAPLIRSERDVYVAAQQRSEPNFITRCRVEAPVTVLDGGGEARAEDLRGHIVCIESADPGYDWLFTRHIAGLVTCYGGANSHMAIRCAEYGLPAAIGCGGILYERAGKAGLLLLDCAGKRITPLHAEV